jgi:SAM-dependent methyltransferase
LKNAAQRDRFEQYDRLFTQARETMALMAVAELGVFKALLSGPKNLDQLAESCGANPGRLRIFLNAVAQIGFLTRHHNDVYGLVPGDEAVHSPDGPRSGILGFLDIDTTFRGMAKAVEVLRTGRPIVAAGTGGDVDPQERRDFLMYLHTAAHELAEETAALLTREPVRRFADLGCGVGTYAFAILKRCPEATAVLVDRPNAVPLIEEIAEQYGVRARVEVRPIDFHTEDYGSDFDLIIMSNLIHCFDAGADQKLVASAARRLAPGGRLAIKDLVIDNDRRGPKSGVWFAILMALFAEGGDTYPASEVIAWLEAAGLEHDVTHAFLVAPDEYLVVGRRVR